MILGCLVCGGKRFLRAAPVIPQPTGDQKPHWDHAATIPCFACTRGARR